MSQAPVRILIVEDQEIIRVGLRLALKSETDLEIVGEAEDGRAAVSKAKELKPDVILMDIKLPVFDGIEAARQVKQISPSPKVIIFTAHDSDEDIFASLAAGAEGYCLKNISGGRLATAIRVVMAGSPWLDPAIAGRVLSVFSNTQLQNLMQGSKTDAIKFPLSARELEVLKLVVDGLANQEIADRLCLSVDTIKTHVRHILEKLAVSDRTQAAVKAMRQGLV